MTASTDELTRFVRDALAHGQSRDAIATALQAAGWHADQVRLALASYAAVDFPLPVPRPRPYLSAREAFLYLLLFATLYVAAWNLGSLLFDLVTRALPDPADQDWVAGRLAASIRWSIASLLIAFPVFVFLARLLGRELEANPARRGSPVRKWLTYVTLFIAAGVLLGDLIVLVDNLLGGELSLRFLLKVGIVAVIAGGCFGYYLTDLRRGEDEA